MMVAGVVKKMTAESAQRAALGAGAIVMDTIAVDDGRLAYQKIERIRQLRPDMVLVAGGIDGGTVSHVVEIAEILAASDPRPRLGSGYNLPVIYCGNTHAQPQVGELLRDKTDLRFLPNIRPVLEKEELGPAREEIHNLFMEHVMAQAPGYKKLLDWTHAPIMPTPAAVGKIIQTVARENGINVIGVDIGGATTDVFSMFAGIFNRTVSANLGMSYSVCNVLVETGIDNILRWLPFSIAPAELKNRIRNKMIRPTTIPHTLEDLLIEQAIAREALGLAFAHHKTWRWAPGCAPALKAMPSNRPAARNLHRHAGAGSLGGQRRRSHAPRRSERHEWWTPSSRVTRLAVDSIFAMPQLGVLSEIHPQDRSSGTASFTWAPCGARRQGPNWRAGNSRRRQVGQRQCRCGRGLGRNPANFRGGPLPGGASSPGGSQYWRRPGPHLAPEIGWGRVRTLPGLPGAAPAPGGRRENPGAPAAQMV